jgi:15-cis-phytoene synthase
MSLATSAAASTGVSLAQSRQYCAALTKREAKNFYYGLKLLPRPKRNAMFALYAYMRLVDDIADGQDGQNISQRLNSLDAWNDATQSALSTGNSPDGHQLWPAFIEMVRTHSVPHRVFSDVIAGQRHDLESPIIETFDQLREYCYRVAGVVGIASIFIWGFEGGAQTESLAINRGIAFQLTNILRDLREDAALGRIYIPRAELKAAGIDEQSLRSGESNGEFRRMMQDQINRAQDFYNRSAPLDSLISPDCRPTLTAMTQIYHGILEKISDDPDRVLHQRVSLSAIEKFRIAWRAARAR